MLLTQSLTVACSRRCRESVSPRAAKRSRRLRLRARVEEGSGSEPSEEEADAWRSEQSERANEDLLVFFYTEELQQRRQRALNEDKFEVVKLISSRLEELGDALKRGRGGKLSAADAEAELTSRQARAAVLRSQLGAAVAEERYADAAALRDALADADLGVLRARGAAASASEPFAFALGQRVTHVRHGWTGVVAGVDRRCQEQEALVNREQPFYTVLPCADELGEAAVLYVAEENLRAGEGLEPVQHPFTYLLFLGPDAAGGYIPCRGLLEKNAAPRRDVHPPEEQADGE